MPSVNNYQSAGASSSLTATIPVYNVGAGTAGQRVLVLYYQCETNPAGPAISGVEWGAGGPAFTQADSVNETQNTGEIWYLNDSDIGVGSQTEDIIVTLVSAGTSIMVAALWLDDVAQTGPEQTVANSSASDTTSIEATLNSVLANSLILNGAGLGSNKVMTQDGTQTKAGAQSQGSAVGSLAYEIVASGNHTQGWTYDTAGRANILLAEWAETAASRSIIDIDGDNVVEAGGTGFIISSSDLDINPLTQSATLDGEALIITDWNGGNPIVSVPASIAIKRGRTDLALVVTDDSGSITLVNVTLLSEAGWEYVEFSGTVPGAGTESGYELAQSDFGYNMVAGDQFIFKSEPGLSYDTETIPRVALAATLTSEYRVWDDTLGAMSAKTSYIIAQKPLLSSGGFTA